MTWECEQKKEEKGTTTLQWSYKALVMGIALTVGLAGAALAQSDWSNEDQSESNQTLGDRLNDLTDNAITEPIKKVFGWGRKIQKGGDQLDRDLDNPSDNASGSSSGSSVFR